MCFDAKGQASAMVPDSRTETVTEIAMRVGFWQLIPGGGKVNSSPDTSCAIESQLFRRLVSRDLAWLTARCSPKRRPRRCAARDRLGRLPDLSQRGGQAAIQHQHVPGHVG